MGKYFYYSLIISLCIVSSTSCNVPKPQVHSLEIFLLRTEQQSEIWKIGRSKIDINKVKLEPEPIVTNKDIDYFDPKKNALVLKKSIQLPTKPSATGLYFVIVADGNRCAIGNFMSPASSIWHPDSTTTLFGDSVSRIRMPKKLNEYLKTFKRNGKE